MNMNRNRVRRMLAASLLGVALSATLCVGSTVAWFNDTLGSQSVLTIGSFDIDAAIASAKQRSATQLSVRETVLPAGVYTLSLRGVGNTPGYGIIYLSATQSDFRKDVYTTPQMGGGSTFTCTLMLHETTAVRVASIWGITNDDNPLKDDAMVYYGRPPVIKTDDESTDSSGGETGSADESAQTTQVTDSANSTSDTEKTLPSTETTDFDDAVQTTQIADKADSASDADTTTKVTETSGTDSAVQTTQVANKVSDALKTDTTTKVTETSGIDNVVQNTQTDGTTQAVASDGETSTQTTDEAEA